MIVDSNIYWIPEELFSDETLMDEFIRCAPKGYNLNTYYERNTNNQIETIVIESPLGYQNLNYMKGQYEMESILEDMDTGGIDVGVLKVPGCHEWLSLELCKVFNDGMAAYQDKSDGRLRALAVVPPWGTKACIDELERCIKSLGMCGVQMSAHYGDVYLDDPMFNNHFRWIDDHDLSVYVHHTPLPVEHTYLLDYNNLRRSYGRCNDQMISVGRELFSDFFKRFPNLRLVHSMLGGGFFAYKNLLLPQRKKVNGPIKRFDSNNDDIKIYLEKNLFFEMSHAAPWGKEQLECAVKVLGAKHILFGSSYPVVKSWQSEGPAFIRSLDISNEAMEQMLSINANELYGGAKNA